MKGPGIKRGIHLKNAKIMDLAPTTLHVLGIPVPADMDGRVLDEAFTFSYLRSNPIKYAKEAKDGTHFLIKKGDEVYSSEDEEEIKSRLRGLGYIP